MRVAHWPEQRPSAIIGEGLDSSEERGGLKKLRDFVARRKLPWPQHYLGGDVSYPSAWGIREIPALLGIDKHGRLHSTTAREEPESLIPQLLRSRRFPVLAAGVNIVRVGLARFLTAGSSFPGCSAVGWVVAAR